jgi:hypothetical protein
MNLERLVGSEKLSGDVDNAFPSHAVFSCTAALAASAHGFEILYIHLSKNSSTSSFALSYQRTTCSMAGHIIVIPVVAQATELAAKTTTPE